MWPVLRDADSELAPAKLTKYRLLSASSLPTRRPHTDQKASQKALRASLSRPCEHPVVAPSRHHPLPTADPLKKVSPMSACPQHSPGPCAATVTLHRASSFLDRLVPASGCQLLGSREAPPPASPWHVLTTQTVQSHREPFPGTGNAGEPLA